MKKTASKNSTTKLRRLIEIGLSLSSEKELSKLLKLILDYSMNLTNSEAAKLYLIKETTKQKIDNVISLQRESSLYLLKSINSNNECSDHSQIYPIDERSIAGCSVKNKEVINWHKNQSLPLKSSQIQSSLDFFANLQLDSIITLPMITADGKVKGIIQLFNKKKETKKSSKKDYFSIEDEELMLILASYCAIALENSLLTESIENLFESFVRASIKAIEARDPTTSGHSDRVAMMTVELALATHKIAEGPFKKVRFSEDQIKEIRYASLLHDFGKIGVSEPVLLKKKKLHDRDLESVLLRFDTLTYSEETMIWKNLCERLIEQQKKQINIFDADVAFKNAQNQIETIKFRLKKFRSDVITANEPQVMSEDFKIDELIEKIVQANHFFNNSVLTQAELKTLSIPRGSLTVIERKEIESHVSHTYEFLKQIAWTDNLSHITTIAHCHHEKMDGTGYPRGIQNDEIPIQSRMMTIADIYDALTAFDRPYKKSLSPARALEILIKDARANKIDGHLLKIFIEAGVFHNATLGTVKKVS
jgi:HD-GYP domain-containing protein (c-di-GMP phosphodiesterase class II)